MNNLKPTPTHSLPQCPAVHPAIGARCQIRSHRPHDGAHQLFAEVTWQPGCRGIRFVWWKQEPVKPRPWHERPRRREFLAAVALLGGALIVGMSYAVAVWSLRRQ